MGLISEYGKKVKGVVNKYPTVAKNYDDMIGMAVFSLDNYNSDNTLKDEVFKLLQEDIVDEKGVHRNFALEIRPAWDEDIQNINPEMVVLRDIESYQ